MAKKKPALKSYLVRCKVTQVQVWIIDATDEEDAKDRVDGEGTWDDTEETTDFDVLSVEENV